MSTIQWCGEEVTFRRFEHDDPRMLGELLVLSAEVLFQKRLNRVAIYECRGTQLLVVAGAFRGESYSVHGYELTDGAKHQRVPEALLESVGDQRHMLPLYHIDHTGDGLTFQFAYRETVTDTAPITRMTLNALRDQAVKLRTL